MHHATVSFRFIIPTLPSINLGHTIICIFIMADHEKHLGISFSSFGQGHNIPNLLGIENHASLATRMRNSLGGLQALGLHKAGLPQIANRNFSPPNVKLTGQVLSLNDKQDGRYWYGSCRWCQYSQRVIVQIIIFPIPWEGSGSRVNSFSEVGPSSVLWL